jgi:FemAB-related protein (PEP-CTERM system-associated)
MGMMKHGGRITRKDMLSDPLALFSGIYPDADSREAAALEGLWNEYRETDRLVADLRTRTKILSRLIGEAKRENRPVDSLLSEMQETSMQLKSLTALASRIENEMTVFFKSGDDDGEGPDQAVLSAPVQVTRAYCAPTANADAISVALMDGEQAAWDAYAERNPAASVYHLSEWREVIRRTFGHEGYYFMARDGTEDVVGILPLIHMKSLLFGNFLVSMPYFNYGGAIADHPVIEQRLMSAANEQASRLGASHVEYRDDIQRIGLPARTEKVNMILTLPDTPDTLLQGFGAKLRSQIRRAQREAPTIHFGQIEYLDDFYTVFARNMRDLGTPVYGKNLFRNILQSFPDRSHIVVARLGGKPVAGAFLIGHHRMLEIPWASALRRLNHLSINTFLYWKILEFAIEKGYRQFDFGRSSRNSGTYRFKEQWGAVPKQLYWHYWMGSGAELPSINPANPKYALMIRLWQQLPLAVSKLLGPPIVKNIP